MLASRWAGALYIIASTGFLLVFGWLARYFDYPDMLARDAAVVLPRLHALGRDGRAVWGVYALLPLLLIPAVAGAAEAMRISGNGTRVTIRLVVSLQVVAALCMTLGLARWSSSHWSLAVAWTTGDSASHDAVRITFDALNAFLGTAIGEFVGELALYGSFVALANALRHRGAARVALLGAVTGIGGWIGMFRNVTQSLPVVQLAADASNILLPLFLIVFGITLLRGYPPHDA